MNPIEIKVTIDLGNQLCNNCNNQVNNIHYRSNMVKNRNFNINPYDHSSHHGHHSHHHNHHHNHHNNGGHIGFINYLESLFRKYNHYFDPLDIFEDEDDHIHRNRGITKEVNPSLKLKSNPYKPNTREFLMYEEFTKLYEFSLNNKHQPTNEYNDYVNLLNTLKKQDSNQ